MLRGHWRDLGFWRWWWRDKVPPTAKVLVGITAVVVFLSGGFLAAVRLASANAELSTGAYTFETTVDKVVTVREHGKIVVKRIPVIRRVFVRPQTAFQTLHDTRVTTTRGGVRVVEKRVVRLVPVITRQVVTVNGKTRTTTETRVVQTTLTRTQTETSVVTSQNTTTLEHTRTVTLPVTVKQTETQATTVTVTQTQNQTLPAQTVINSVTVTVPLITVTITLPGH